MSVKELLELTSQVAEIIRPRRLRPRTAPGPLAVAPPPQELVLRRSYQVAAEEAVRELQRGEEVARRFREEDERSRAKLAVDSKRLG
ncbi:unnamed protein product, partial [marine sediment metagenome]